MKSLTHSAISMIVFLKVRCREVKMNRYFEDFFLLQMLCLMENMIKSMLTMK